MEEFIGIVRGRTVNSTRTPPGWDTGAGRTCPEEEERRPALPTRRGTRRR